MNVYFLIHIKRVMAYEEDLWKSAASVRRHGAIIKYKASQLCHQELFLICYSF